MKQYFEFAGYLKNNFEFWSNTKKGDVYLKHRTQRIYNETQIFEEFLNQKNKN